MRYIGDSELLTFTREELDEVLDRFANKLIEKVFCSIPDMIVHLSKRTEHLNGLYKELFKDHPECAEDKKLLADVIQGLELRNPGMVPDELFKKVPEEYKKAKILLDTKSSIDFSKLNETVNGVL